MFFPWSFRKFVLVKILGMELEKGAKIGYSLVLAKHVHLGKKSKIGHLTICKEIDELFLDDNSKIGNRNYITGFSVTAPQVLKYHHFAHVINRQCVLHVGKNTTITSRHYFDCNGGIFIGDFSEVAGFETSFMTHSIDLENNRQDAKPILIGDYTFIGARCLFLKGSAIPSNSIVGASSLVNKKWEQEFYLYAGIPAKPLKSVSNYKFFSRLNGFVD